MAVRPVPLLGDPILRAQCEAVKNVRSPAVRVVADDLQDTLRALKKRHGKGRGLSAPQIGAPLRIVYIEIDRPWFLANPEIVDIGTHDFTVWDECFSIPNLIVRVQRAYYITVKYTDLSGKSHTVEAEGELAELLQHEIDHLDGVLIVDRPVGLDPFCFHDQWERHRAGEGRHGKPVPRTLVPA
ncbi:MAG: peptide deformylase [Gemmatimonadales bacterium]|nr:peptide deformylase [Gemmatimonadales bacterium]NIN10423.1 peptide deformylase [Gemmatimonadales bacterium]NIN49215.1 peptide deformylase [Gemmatimonadales bacterium]NIP06679.1 peptide deformylase [Gemmatimonadales bacterium]NIR00010.1 peptide deformylase [Gemmatimonadales bacterium]